MTLFTNIAMYRDAQTILDVASSFVCEDTTQRVLECKCGKDHVYDAALRARRDPTRTLDLRRAFIRNLERRWRAVARLVTQALTQQDVFGLGGANVQAIQYIAMSSGRVNAFQSWIDTVLADVVLGLSREQWIGEYVGEAYRRGWKTASLQVGRNLPINEDRAAIITKLTISELQGVIEAFSQRAVRAFSDGLLSHLPPAIIARTIRQAIDKIGIVRSRATVQTVIVRANGEAALDYFQLAGIKQVGILPETLPSPGRMHAIRDAARQRRSNAKRKRPRALVNVLTAGDDDVCIICQDIADGNPYTIAEARGLIPAHPNCRCAFVPLDDLRFAHGDSAFVVDDWNEEDHPRGPGGEFGSGGGSNQNSDKLEKIHDKSIKNGLSEDEKNAVQDYVDGSGEINGALRGGADTFSAANADTIEKLDGVFARTSLSEKMEVSRGASSTVGKALHDAYVSNPGKSVTALDKAFVSTSTDWKEASRFASGTRIDISLPKGSKAFPLGKASNMHGLKEVLIARGSKFEITSATSGKGGYHIKMRLKK